MTREDAYYERIMLMCGYWEDYDRWLDVCLETEEPLSDIVLELLDCRGDRKETEYRLRLFCLEKPFNEEAVYERLRLLLHGKYKSGEWSKDDVMTALSRFSANIPFCDFQIDCSALSDYYDLAEEGIVSMARFDPLLERFLEDGESFDTKEFWGEGEPGSSTWIDGETIP